MSTTTSGIFCKPAGAAKVAIADGAGAWVYGSWTQIDVSMPAGAVLAGVMFRVTTGTLSQLWSELEIGVGAAAAEVSIANLRIGSGNTGNGTFIPYFLPIPIGGIAAQRLSARLRTQNGSVTFTVAALYYDTLDASLATTNLLTATSRGSTASALTPNASAWVNSSWIELTPGIAAPLGVVGVSTIFPAIAGEFEIDVGTGAAGAEAVITTLRRSFGSAAGGGGGPLDWLHLPGPYMLPANTRVAWRLRKHGTSTSAWQGSLLYYHDLTIGGGGGERFYSRWM